MPDPEDDHDKRRRNLDYPMGLSLTALRAILTVIAREYPDAIVIDNISPVTWGGSAVAEVRAADGPRFYVGASRRGAAFHGLDQHQVVAQVQRAGRHCSAQGMDRSMDSEREGGEPI